jgi:hypothetical protein
LIVCEIEKIRLATAALNRFSQLTFSRSMRSGNSSGGGSPAPKK